MIPILCVLIAMASIQSGASLAKELFPITGVLGAAALRLFLASVVLSLVFRPWKVRLSKHEALPIFAYGASLGLMNLFFYLALDRIPLGIAVALEFVGPLSIALYMSRRPIDYLWALLAASGIFLILPLGENVQSVNFLGIFFALLAGAFWASYILFGHKIGKNSFGGVTVCLGMIVATLFVAPVGLAFDGSKIFSLKILPLALGLAVLSSALPYSLEMIGLRKMQAKTFSILMSLEPALAALSGLVFLGEHLSMRQWIAILCVMVASAGSALLTRK